MPLSFASISHGQVAFGFFNIESDMLLLEELFFFADVFCAVLAASLPEAKKKGEASGSWPGFRFDDRNRIGDLMGAIHGIRYTGFLGELYRRYPFPAAPEGFKQKTHGFQTQPEVTSIIKFFAGRARISFACRWKEWAQIGSIRFDWTVFQDLIRYVWKGGYPGWENGQPPEAVLRLQKELQAQDCWIGS
jgi:hypothetical protein